MAWWKLVITDKPELSLDDQGHISELVLQGYTEGELTDDEDEKEATE